MSVLPTHVDSSCLGEKVLDRLARQCGEPSGIGRTCLLDDATLAGIVRRMTVAPSTTVLELGCGRGFLARWLRAGGCTCEYVGLDALVRSPAMVSAPPSTTRCDRIFAIESFSSAATAQAGAAYIRTRLADSGRFAVTVAEFASSQGLLQTALASLNDAAVVDDVTDLTPRVRDFATMQCSAMLMTAWDESIRDDIVDGASTALRDIEAGTFRYSLVTGMARKA